MCTSCEPDIHDWQPPEIELFDVWEITKGKCRRIGIAWTSDDAQDALNEQRDTKVFALVTTHFDDEQAAKFAKTMRLRFINPGRSIKKMVDKMIGGAA